MDFFMNKKIFISFIIPFMYYLYNCKSNNIKKINLEEEGYGWFVTGTNTPEHEKYI
jgi:hypothetical protein